MVKVFAGSRRVDPRPLTKEEEDYFEDAWAYGLRYYNRNAVTPEPFLNPLIKSAVKDVLGTYLKIQNMGFEGVFPTSGVGMQPIIPLDVFGASITSGYDTWDQSWGSANVINAWIYNRAEALGTSAFQASGVSDIVPRDSNNDRWALAIIGFQDLAPNPVIEAVRWSQAKEVIGDFFIGNQLRAGEQKFADINCVIAQLPDIAFSAGVYVTSAGRSALAPVGFSFVTGNRARQNGVNLRNRPQSA